MMRLHRRPLRSLVAASLLTLGAGLGALAAVGAGKAPPPRDVDAPPRARSAAVRPLTPPAAGWKEVDRLVDEQKMQAALDLASKLRAEAQRRKDDAEWARGLVREVQLRLALHGYETAVRFLREQPWPSSPLPHTLLDLFYAHALVTYQNAYAWEIGKREEVVATTVPDLKLWTREQIVAEAERAYLEAWKQRAAWGTTPVTVVREFVTPNDYPPGIRGTLRDAVSYLLADLLADTSLWEPRASNEVYALPLDALIGGQPPTGATAESALADPAPHPLVKLAAVLGDLERWHAAAGRAEAAFEARRTRLEDLHAAFTGAADREKLRVALEQALAALGDSHPWWSRGQATLAQWTRAGDDPQALVRAHEIALRGRQRHPDSVGGRLCARIVAEIEAPEYSLQSMATDAPGKRSIAVTHRNLPRLWLRAYAVDVDGLLRQARDYNLLPNWREVQDLVASGKPASSWSADLPATPDFRTHRTFLTPPLQTPGLYVVVASSRQDFADAANRKAAVDILVSDVVLVSRAIDGGFAVDVLSGTTGKPLPGAQVELWRFDWNQGHHREQTATTDRDGAATLRWDDGNSYHFLVARAGGQIGLDPEYLTATRQPEPTERTGALVYTDRAVYRPGQKLLWKVIAFHGTGGDLHTLPGREMAVELLDANGQVVASQTVTGNRFGSAAGSFEIPAGKLLGAWRLRSSLGGQTPVQVEEYKRPTFEVTLKEPAEALRLNRAASLAGEARYYFGLPVTSGRVRWQVTREPVYPVWWWWWYGGARPQPQVIAAGTAALAADGTFRVPFTPAADEREARTPGLTYHYVVGADVTDDGGETRSAERGVTLGFVAVQASIEPAETFFLQGEKGVVTVRRTDLDGTPRAGAGAWRLVRLRQPATTLLPADQPVPLDPQHGDAFRTPGDRLRPRWDTDVTPEAILHGWEDGDEVAHGALQHDAQGEATLTLPAVDPGAYRLRYTTTDPFGATYENAQELLVVAPGRTPLALPAILRAQRHSVAVGQTLRVLVHSGLPDQQLELHVRRPGGAVETRRLDSRGGAQVIELPIGEAEHGGLALALVAVRDHQAMTQQESVLVPWDEKKLRVEFATFRDTLRPRSRETWRVVVHAADGKTLGEGAAELLAYMYDRSLDLFAEQHPADPLTLYPGPPSGFTLRTSLRGTGETWSAGNGWPLPDVPSLTADRLTFLDGYGIGGPGVRRFGGVVGGVAQPMAMAEEKAMAAPAAPPAPQRAENVAVTAESGLADKLQAAGGRAGQAPPPPQLRSDFAETAFWYPQLLTAADGSVAFEMTVPDSVTQWNLWVHAITEDLRAGSTVKQVRTVKELMVRPYLPRFLREGDEADLQVTVNDAGSKPFTGTLRFEIVDPDSGADLAPAFGLPAARALVPFTVEPGKGTTLSFPVKAPARIGTVAFRVTAQAGDWSDGELRPVPVLPGRMHLIQSRFATLRDADRRVLRFADMAKGDDPTLLTDQLVVTVDGQLFNTVLSALPYLVQYPYECTEQTLNRFLSTAIVSKVFTDHPALAKLGKDLAAQRATPLEPWALDDPNRKMALEETPWLVTARGGDAGELPVLRILDPQVAAAQRDSAMDRLQKAQTSLGAFPWWPGGPPSPYMTLYLLAGLSRAREAGIAVPQDMVQRAWGYMHRHYLEEMVLDMRKHDCCWETVTLLSYVLSSYDEQWTGGVFTAAERKEMLAFSFRHWKQHSPLLKAMLAVALHRAHRDADATLVFDSVMDSSHTTPDEGTSWAPEDRAWLWYEDTIETHAYVLRALTEMKPNDARRHGLVQWLLLNKKLDHWDSTRSTAEVIYALVQYMEHEGELGQEEDATVAVGNLRRTFRFLPDRVGAEIEGGPAVVSGAPAPAAAAAPATRARSNQLVVEGPQVDPRTMSEIVVEKQTKGFLFASATWHFSTEKLPAEARGDLFGVTRSYFLRSQEAGKWKLVPLVPGTPLRPGDQLEVHLSIRSRAGAEYVHLRDPRPAGCEPENLRSGYKWETLPVYEEIRDSGANYFFEWLPAGEYTFVHRLRVNLPGTFRVAPAELQSMYAPEFAAYSAGDVVKVLPANKEARNSP